MSLDHVLQWLVKNHAPSTFTMGHKSKNTGFLVLKWVFSKKVALYPDFPEKPIFSTFFMYFRISTKKRQKPRMPLLI